jgi:hypothetical protein
VVAALPFALADPTAEHGTERHSPASAQVEFIDSSAEGIAMTAPDRFIAWCKQEEASVEQQLECWKRVRSEQAKILERAGLIRPLSQYSALGPGLPN